MSARSYTELVNLARLGMRSVIEMVRGNRNADLGMIHEVSQHMRAQRSPNLPDPMGFCLPWEALTRAGLDSVTTAKGAELHQTNPVGVETVMSVSPVLRRAKAMRALFSPQTIPVEVSGATASHVAENPGSDVSITEMTLSGVSAVMRTAIVATQATLQLRRVSLGASDDAILGDIRKVLALAMENKAINGSGTNEPLGIVSNTAIGTTTLGTNGATIGGADLAELVRSVEDADLTDVELSGAFVTNPKQRKVLSITERAAGSGYMIGASGLVLMTCGDWNGEEFESTVVVRAGRG